MSRRASLLAVLLLAACSPQAPQDERQAPRSMPKNTRDREICRSTVAEYTKDGATSTIRAARCSAATTTATARATCPRAMDAYGDNRSTDRLIARCMEQRGYPPPSKTVVAEDRQLS